MEEIWQGTAIHSDPTMAQEGSLEAAVIAFEIFCAVRHTYPDASANGNEVAERFGIPGWLNGVAFGSPAIYPNRAS